MIRTLVERVPSEPSIAINRANQSKQTSEYSIEADEGKWKIERSIEPTKENKRSNGRKSVLFYFGIIRLIKHGNHQNRWLTETSMLLNLLHLGFGARRSKYLAAPKVSNLTFAVGDGDWVAVGVRRLTIASARRSNDIALACEGRDCFVNCNHAKVRWKWRR